MAPRGGYKKGVDIGAEYVRLHETLDAEGKITARSMGQDYRVWISDAVEHHVYRCEMLLAQERYQHDAMAAAQRNSHTPDRFDPRYQVTRPKPEITRPAGQGSAAGGPKPRP